MVALLRVLFMYRDVLTLVRRSGCHLSLHAAIVRVEAQKSKNALIMKYPCALLPPPSSLN